MELQRVGHDNNFHFTSFPWYKPEFFSLKQKFHHTPHPTPIFALLVLLLASSPQAVMRQWWTPAGVWVEP